MEVYYICEQCGEENITFYDDVVFTPSQITFKSVCLNCNHIETLNIEITREEKEISKKGFLKIAAPFLTKKEKLKRL